MRECESEYKSESKCDIELFDVRSIVLCPRAPTWFAIVIWLGDIQRGMCLATGLESHAPKSARLQLMSNQCRRCAHTDARGGFIEMFWIVPLRHLQHASLAHCCWGVGSYLSLDLFHPDLLARIPVQNHRLNVRPLPPKVAHHVIHSACLCAAAIQKVVYFCVSKKSHYQVDGKP